MTVSEDVARLNEDLERYKQAKEWLKVVETIDELVEHEPDSMRKGKWCEVAGQICRDDLVMRERAVEYFDRALDSYFKNMDAVAEALLPMVLKPFRAIERMRSDYSEWTGLVVAYRKMVDRVSTSTKFGDLRAELIKKLEALEQRQGD
jgi:hypothetical protein